MRGGVMAGLLLLAAPAGAQTMDHAGHGGDTPAMDSIPAIPDAPGNAPPPPVPTDHPADAFFSPQRMVGARTALAGEGRWRGGAVMVDRFELRSGAGGEGQAWRASAWYGSELDRIVLSTEGEGAFGGALEQAELRAVWRHAIGPWFNLDLGMRQDFRPQPRRTYAVLGIEGLAPYWIETAAQLFVSDKGDVHVRLEASYDARLAGQLLLQPEAELNLAFQDVPALAIGAGVERIELGARLRYELRPELAPYVGFHWERKLGGTASVARAAGSQVSAVSAVAGIRAFF